MKKLFLLVLCLNCINLFAQISEGGLPPSFKNTKVKSTAQIVTFSLPELDTVQLLASDRENATPMRYGVVNDVCIDIKASGTKTYLESYKGNIWQYRINARDSKSVMLAFEKFRVPDNAQLFIYNEDYSMVKGAFTSLNMREDLNFVLADFPGEHVIIEYFEPADTQFEGEVVIGSIGQAYIDIFGVKSANADSENLINVNCEEGIPWQDQKHSVCKITFNDGLYGYLCSGAFINNTANNGKPYFLTANHCISSNAIATTTVAYFNYETSGCTDELTNIDQTLSGATVQTTGKDSDYTLLLFTDNIPLSYKPFFAGWNVAGEVTDSTAGIHHPQGKVKKISIDHDATISYEQSISWEGGSVTPAGTHWGATFDEGTTYGGSSGSPLFDENKLIIGQLHGGDPTDYYGKLSYSWTHPSYTYGSIQSYLDPGLTGATSLASYYPSSTTPDPQFTSDFKKVCASSYIELSGYSAFAPTSWQWTFSPSTVTYQESTLATSQNPVVSFDNAGFYDVILAVTNASGTETRTFTEAIDAGSDLAIKAIPLEITDSCSCNFTGVQLLATGAEAYQWTLTGDATSLFSITNETANPVEIKPINPLSGNTNLTVSVTGTQGTCSTILNYELPLITPNNDNIADAIEITATPWGPYSNKCASIETGEPVPNHDSCTGQLSWCDEYGTGENIVEHSVWFYITPATSQSYTIYSRGYDNQLALYSADSFSDILNGNYTILAANDDYTSEDFNPRVNNINLLKDHTYWIQVDGSGGGTTGEFKLYFSTKSGVEDISGEELNITVYPLPACDNVYIESPEFTGVSSILIELYNASGSKVSTFTETDGDAKIDVPLSGLSSGVYFARLLFNNMMTTVKILK